MNDAPLWAFDAKIDSDELWMLSWEYDVLMLFDLREKRLSRYYVVPRNETIPYMHFMLTITNDRVYILPYTDSDLYYVDRHTYELKNIRINVWNTDKEKKVSFAAHWENKLCMFGLHKRGIVVYDEITENLSVINENMFECLEKMGLEKRDLLFNEYYCQIENIVYAPIHNSSFIVKTNIENDKFDIFDLSKEGIKNIITIDDLNITRPESFILTTADGKVVVWSPLDGVKHISNYSDLNDDKYLHVFSSNEHKIFIKWSDERIVVRDSSDNDIILTFDGAEKEEIKKEGKFGMVIRVGDYIYFQRRKDKYVYKVNMLSNSMEKENLVISQEKKRRILVECYKNGLGKDIYTENNDMDAEMFLAIIGK